MLDDALQILGQILDNWDYHSSKALDEGFKEWERMAEVEEIHKMYRADPY